MTDKKTGGPAFPLPLSDHLHPADTEFLGMTVRDYFAMQAPKEVPYWFQPKIRQKPASKWVDDAGNEYKTRYLAERAVGENYRDQNVEAIEEWERDLVISKMVQWPWFWADLHLEARNA